MNLTAIAAPVRRQRLAEIDAALAQREPLRAHVVAALRAHEAAADTLAADRPRHEGPHEANDRDQRIRQHRDAADILRRGPRNAWDRSAAFLPIALAAGTTPPPGSLDPTEGMRGVIAMDREITQLREERAAVVAELQQLESDAHP